MSRHAKNTTASNYTITVWAGSDMYTQIRLPWAPYSDDPSLEYEEVSNRIRSRIEGEFGRGAELVRRSNHEYDVSVDKVAIEP